MIITKYVKLGAVHVFYLITRIEQLLLKPSLYRLKQYLSFKTKSKQPHLIGNILGAILLVIIIYVIFFNPRIVSIQGKTMGTSYSIKYRHSYLAGSLNKIKSQVETCINNIDNSMSTYKKNSELMLFNAHPVNTYFPASKNLIDIISLSQSISELSDGAYDITIAPLVNLWGFGPPIVPHKYNSFTEPKDHKINLKLLMSPSPTQQSLALAQGNIGYKNIKIDSYSGTICKTSTLTVDLSSIAKGFAVDKVSELLDSFNIKGYMIEIGGEIKTFGRKTHNQPWRIAIRNPDSDTWEANKIISSNDFAIATSGDYINFQMQEDGTTYSHLIDPKTARPISHNLVSVTVIDKQAAIADAYATMFMILGVKKGLDLAEKAHIATYFIYRTNDKVQTSVYTSHASTQFNKYLAWRSNGK